MYKRKYKNLAVAFFTTLPCSSSQLSKSFIESKWKNVGPSNRVMHVAAAASVLFSNRTHKAHDKNLNVIIFSKTSIATQYIQAKDAKRSL